MFICVCECVLSCLERRAKAAFHEVLSSLDLAGQSNQSGKMGREPLAFVERIIL